MAATSAVAVVGALLHLVQINYYLWPSDLFNAYHLGFALTLVFLSAAGGASADSDITPTRSAAAKVVFFLALLLGIGATVYIHFEYEALVRMRAYMPNTSDMIVAGVLVAVTTIAVGREWGWIIPAVVAAVLLYGYFGNLMPEGLFYHGGIPFTRLAGLTSIPYFNGLLGSLAGISATTLFVFLLFAGMLKANGGVNFIIELARRLFGHTRAGPALVAVFGSGLMAMISGSSVANIASTGSVTIPAMKSHGYSPPFAGAVEAVASNGGQIMPPVMGLAAFIMIGMTGHSYAEIAFAAMVPGIIYYAYLMVAVQFYAMSRELQPAQRVSDEGPSLATLTLFNAASIIGIVVLLAGLVLRYPAETCVTASLLALGVLELVKQLALNSNSPAKALSGALRIVSNGLDIGARNGAKVAVIMCLIGILVEVFVVTGLGQKLANQVTEMAGYGLIVILLLVAISCIVLGCGLPTTAAYVMVALLSAPVLAEAGVSLLAAHLFVFYFANLSAITPPVAIGALIAANLAGAPFLRTAMESMRLALPAFVLPFLFVLNPAVIGIDATPLQQLAAAGSAALALLLFTSVSEGVLLKRLHLIERGVLLAAALLMLHTALWTSAIGFIVLCSVAASQFRSRMRERHARPE